VLEQLTSAKKHPDAKVLKSLQLFQHGYLTWMPYHNFLLALYIYFVSTVNPLLYNLIFVLNLH